MNRLYLAILASAVFHGSLFAIVLERTEALPKVNVQPGKTSVAIKMNVSSPQTPPKPEPKNSVEPKNRRATKPRPVNRPQPQKPEQKRVPDRHAEPSKPTPPEPSRSLDTPEPSPVSRQTQEPDPPQEIPQQPSVARAGARWVKKANYRTNPSPDYPPVSRERGEEGTVILKVTVNKEGEPTQVHVRTSSGHDRLDQAAVEAVSQWQFTPAEQSGVKMATTVLVPIRFQLK